MAVLRRDDLAAFEYKEIEHAGFLWVTCDEGARFILGVDDWSPKCLAVRSGWEPHQKRYHTSYVAHDQEGKGYIVKVYQPERNRARFFSRKGNRAKNEFSKTLLACKKGIQTVLPLAVAQGKEDDRWGIIIYPFLDQAIPLERVYECNNLSLLSIR